MRPKSGTKRGRLLRHWKRQLIAISDVNSSEATSRNASSSLPPSTFSCELSPFSILQQMGPTHPTQIIRNRHFTSLELRDNEQPEKGRLVGTVAVSSQSLLDKWEKSLDRAQKEEHFHMLLPLEWRVAESNICGSGKLIQLQYELFHRMLSEEAQIRSEQNRHLEETEIWYIVWTLAQVADQCARSGERLSDISLDNIFMNKTGNIKILTPFSLPDSYDPYFQPNPTNIYFSPQELKGRQIGQMYNQSDSIKSASFASGMLLLSLSLLKPLYYLYNNNKNTLQTDKLEEQLQNLSKVTYLSAEFNIYQNYSQSYQKLIRKLLQIDPTKRVIISQVYDQLKPNIAEIANLKSFEFEVPQPLPASPLKRNSLQKDTIALGSHKIKKPSLTQSPPISEIKSEKPKIQALPPNPPVESKPFSAFSGFTESKPISGFTEANTLGSGFDLLKRIDERLMRSRQEFPS